MRAISAELATVAAPRIGRRRAKRALDIVASAFGLAFLSPVFALSALAIRLEDGGPAFFRQTRVGAGGRTFSILKFRSMKVARSAAPGGVTVDGDRGITKVGAFIRWSKIDELPQLYNVLTGDMSLVGPRPELPDLMECYTPPQRAVMQCVRPGMTDYASLQLRHESALLAQVNDPARFYREVLMPFKCEQCARYVREMSLATDLRIIWATLAAVAGVRGAAAREFPPARATRIME